MLTSNSDDTVLKSDSLKSNTREANRQMKFLLTNAGKEAEHYSANDNLTHENYRQVLTSTATSGANTPKVSGRLTVLKIKETHQFTSKRNCSHVTCAQRRIYV